MQPFAYHRPSTLAEATTLLNAPGAMAMAGGTEVLNWMKEGIVAPRSVVDIARLEGLADVRLEGGTLRIGALATLSDVAADRHIRRAFPVIGESLLASASPQIRNMATVGGNLLQRTRCPYFRADSALPCNLRTPGTGCSALGGEDRAMAIFGWDERCIATHPSDLAVALVAFDARIEIAGADGIRTLPLSELYAPPTEEIRLRPADLVTAIVVEESASARRSHYLKLRERASYEFALISVGAALSLAGGRVSEARLAVGGVAHKPWRLSTAELALRGLPISDTDQLRAAIAPSFVNARAGRHNGFKAELALRACVRAIQTVGARA